MQATTIGKKLYLGFLAVIVATGVVPALLSTIPALGCGSRPIAARTRARRWSLSRTQVPSAVHLSK